MSNFRHNERHEIVCIYVTSHYLANIKYFFKQNLFKLIFFLYDALEYLILLILCRLFKLSTQCKMKKTENIKKHSFVKAKYIKQKQATLKQYLAVW